MFKCAKYKYEGSCFCHMILDSYSLFHYGFLARSCCWWQAAEDFDVVILHELDDARGDRPIALSPFWLFE